MGHKKIGGLFRSFDNRIYRERYEGMKEAIFAHGLEFDENLVLFDIEDSEKSYQIIEKHLRKEERPGAFFASDDMPVSYTHLDVYKRQTILCAADRDAQFDLYEDDGVSMDYENGKYLRTKISLTAGERTFLEFKNEGEYETAVETIAIDMIHREKAPYWVSLDGEQLPHFLHRRKFEEAECGWYYSQRLKSVQVRYRNPKKMCIRDRVSEISTFQ